ncbi:uncharacterized protein LOC121246289 [Juglans microcarpa x Juglans regia]|uniref:uncharacterized protein LOC121246289 n=1 Tax=Juglans microcarpa x Juglans regia TaxID=2249226 RepID=UPI001B7EA34A|nr:uncharacterized protein LOC121246289 [Juglans microcarpa x Juglans regia]
MDHLSPLGPYGKNHSVAFEESLIPTFQEKLSTVEMLSFGSKPPDSVEDGKEVDQASGSPSFYSKSLIRAPLGISLKTKGMRKVLWSGSMTAIFTGTYQNEGELPNTSSLRKRLEQKWETEGVKISMDCANLLNNGFDVYLKRLINPCLDLAGSRKQRGTFGDAKMDTS